MPYKNKNSDVALESLRKARRKWYKNNKEKQLKAQKERAQWNRRLIARYKSMFLSCTHCGYSFRGRPETCDFHHVDPKDKKSTINIMATYGLNGIKKELSKCIPLCANCHRIHHKNTPRSSDTLESPKL